MDLAHMAKRRGNCLRRQVGALVVNEHRIISTGYNGTPRGIRNCFEGGCPRCAGDTPSGEGLGECICCHAEENAITHAAYYGTALNGATIYCTLSPCLLCVKLIINSGIREVIYEEEYQLQVQAAALLAEAGVTCRRYVRA